MSTASGNGEHGLRTAHMGYDRLFLIGDQSWQDYEVTAVVTIHEIAAETGPVSGGNGLGLILRFAGHVVGGPSRFPIAQPKWGYLPLGAIAWLRWRKGRPDDPALKQFFPGDSTTRPTMARSRSASASGTSSRRSARRCRTIPRGMASPATRSSSGPPRPRSRRPGIGRRSR